MVSKELLSEVLDTEVLAFEVSNNKIKYKEQYYSGEDDKYHKVINTINIHELAHKCKEWAWEYGQEMASYRVQDTETPYYRCITATTSLSLNRDLRHGFFADTETEAIFKACEWLRKNK